MRFLWAVLLIASTARSDTLGEVLKAADAAWERGDFATTVSLLEQARARAPDEPVPALKLGRVERAWAATPGVDARGHLRAAIAWFDEASSRAGADADLRRDATREREAARALLAALPTPPTIVSTPPAAAVLPSNAVPPPGARTWTWVAGGVAVLAGASALLAWRSAESLYDGLRDSCGDRSAIGAGCGESDRRSVDHRVLAANVLAGTAALAGAGAVALYFVEGRARVRVSASPGGLSVSAPF